MEVYRRDKGGGVLKDIRGLIYRYTDGSKRNHRKQITLVWPQNKSNYYWIHFRLFIKITLNAQPEKYAIHREYLLGYAFRDH